jgi:amino acid adenylation domain-containing protein
VAYVVGQEDQPPRLEDLRSWIEDRLPDYMMPSAFVLLPALPLTANGKVDRKALPAPERAVTGASEGFTVADPMEELLAGILAEVLALPRVGPHDDFFALGGHSLLATQVVSRIRQVFGVELVLRQFFEAPTVAQLSRVVREARAEGLVQVPPIVPVPRQGDLPLSFAQQRLWFLDQLDPENAAYNLPAAMRLSGEISVDLLERVFTEVVRRHEVLRTTFSSLDGKPAQVIAPPAARVALPVIDLSSLPAAAREPLALALALEEARYPFDLERGPMLRLALVRLESLDHLLLMTMHHVASDGWSQGVLMREIGILHDAFSQDLPSPLPELPVQYADFAVCQRSWLQGDVLEAQIAYWKRQLAEAPRVLDLPTDRPRPASQTFRGAIRPVAFPAAMLEAVHSLCRREGVTSFMVLLAAWSVLLGRHAGQDDVLVGTPVAGRNRREIEDLIGFFVNTLVLRADLAGAPSFTELLGRVRGAALDAFAHQDLPFERVVEELVTERDLSRSPLIQAVFAQQNVFGSAPKMPGVAISQLVLDSGVAKFDLLLALYEIPDGLAGSLQHNTHLFDGSTAERLLARFAALLEGAVADPGRSVADLPLLLPAELGEVLWERNATAAAYPREANLPELFAAVAGEHPDAPAIVSDGEVWSYRDLDEASNRLARHLLRLGVGPESAVGISMERSPELILGTLAILKAGGAYVPLDASYPAERLAFMLADTGAQLALAHAPTWDRVAACGARLVAVDSRATGGDWEREDARPLAVRGFRIPAESLAYVIYTSGSTGRPKGVGVPHRAIVRLVRETNYVHLGLGDRTGQVANISFDAATYEIWGALLNGAAVVVIPREVVLSPAAFAAALREQRVTSMFLTSALFTKMAREVPDAFAGMSELLVGGEAVDPAAARTVLAGSPPQRLLNGYGPTESTTFAAWHPIREVPEGAAAIPIGLPLANTTLSVLDRWQAPVPPGSVGELCIGGDGLARGYLNRPDLTAERFVPHPWPANGNLGERLYRTGDLARCPRHPDGPIELLGRVDDQVKIRGFRIEPGEIEAVLAGHPRVREQAVVAREDGSGQSRLVAYVAGLGGPAPRSEELRSWLQERLPDYMVPAAFVSLAALPLTPNGKVDRKALPAPEPGAAGEGFAAADPIDPLDPVTGLVANIWAEVLGLERVGRHDNFFALGGHSLLATQVVSRIRQVLGVELPLRELFESPTVAALAEIIRASWQEETGTATPPPPPITPITGITETPRGAGIPLSFAQQRLWLIDQLEPGNPAYNIPMAVRLTGEVTAGLLERIFAEVVRRHEVLRTLFAYREGVPVQVIIPACDWRVELPVVDLAGLPQEEREARAGALGLEEALRPFDLATGPLLRLTLVRLAGREHLLLLTLHHICSDGWSMGVLLREIAALFAAFSQGRPSPLPELPVQYADFAVWQRSWLQGEVLEAQLSSWLAQLAGAPRLLDLPTDRPRPALQTFRGGSRPLALTELSAALRELCLREGVTPFMALLAAWAAVLGRHAGQDDILVGSPIAGRNRQETEGLIGFFVNTLVLRADLSGAPAFGELLGRVRRTALDAFARQDLPFERLVEELVPERDLAVSPLVQVLFVMQNAPQGGLAVPGLLLSPMNVDSGLAKFDLTLSLTEGPAGFTGGLEHNADLFDGATAERLLARFAALLEGAVADPGRAIPDLPLLLPAELDQIRQRNATWTAYPREASLPELFAAVAREHPDAPAVITNQAAAGGEVWTYRQLDEGSNRLARRLQRLGVGPESAVGISMERSPEMILGTLAILKAGGFYVPLDPDYPDERLEFMRADVGAAVVLKDIKDIGDIKDEEDGGPLGVRVPAEALAYVIYTSGSTGRPKGVAVPHRAVVRLVRETNFVHLGPGDRIGQVASISFDAATYEIWGALLNGAAVVVIPREVVLSPAAFAAALREQRVTSMFLTASLFTRMAQEAPDAFAEMKELLVGGEAVDPAAARTVLAGSPPRCLLNGYGPTESTTFAAWHWIREVPEGAAGVPIGLPLSNTTLYVLDRWQAPVPPGSVGELCIGGDGLARGYLNRPELTAERFVPHPDGDGERLYRTGDLARSRPSEPIELLGRVDDQVKIRGFRIEPGEIEAVLAAHPAVREQAVVARRDGRGETRLVAYVAMIAAGDPAPPPEELRAWLRERLPDYMMPAGFVVLPALPLTPNGKVDRRALPAPELSDPTDPVDPIDPITELLARIFAEVLDRDRVGIRDNFFRIGGHSLLATQVVSRIRQVLGVELPLRELFDSPTVVDLAGAVRVALTEGVQ